MSRRKRSPGAILLLLLIGGPLWLVQNHPVVAVCYSSQRIWDTLAVQRVDRFRERTTANHAIERMGVRFELGAARRRGNVATRTVRPTAAFRTTTEFRSPATPSSPFTTASGLNEVFLVSNHDAAQAFHQAWSSYRAAFEVAPSVPAAIEAPKRVPDVH